MPNELRKLTQAEEDYAAFWEKAFARAFRRFLSTREPFDPNIGGLPIEHVHEFLHSEHVSLIWLEGGYLASEVFTPESPARRRSGA